MNGKGDGDMYFDKFDICIYADQGYGFFHSRNEGDGWGDGIWEYQSDASYYIDYSMLAGLNYV